MKRSIPNRALALALVAGVGCGDESPLEPGASHRQGELTARPGTPAGPLFGAGEHVVDLGLERDPVLYVPQGHDPQQPAPLLVLFHGSEGHASAWRVVYEHADRVGVVLLMMQSDKGIWDFFLESGFAADAAAVDAALHLVFDRVAVDPATVGLGGFSAGATYSVQLGLRNPELVHHVIAWSGEFYPITPREPLARLFITHGTMDDELPVFGARRLVELLEREGYDVTYTEFEGGHVVPEELLRAGFDWLVEPTRDWRSIGSGGCPGGGALPFGGARGTCTGGKGTVSTIDETYRATQPSGHAGPILPRHRIEFPRPGGGTPDQDEASFYLVEGGEREEIRFHEYGEIYRRPGLYEQLFYDRLKCQSPGKVSEILAATLTKNAEHHSELRVLDLGAGNGMSGEAVAKYGVARLVGVDIVAEARDAAFRDRPGLYDHYYVLDMGRLDDAEREELEAWSFDCLLTVAALGFGDIPARVLAEGFGLVSDNAWIAFNIKDSFLDPSDTSGFSTMVRELVFSDYMDLHHLERYRHRLAIDGKPLYYYAVVARKTGRPFPERLLDQIPG